MANEYGFADKTEIYIRSGNIQIIDRQAAVGGVYPDATISDFSAETANLATIETNTGILIKPETEGQIFDGMDEEIQLRTNTKFMVTFTVGELSNNIIALLSGRDPDNAGVIDETTEAGYQIVDLWSTDVIHEFHMKIYGTHTSGLEVGYIFHNVTFKGEDLPGFKGKEAIQLAVTATCDMSNGASPGYSYLDLA